MLDRHTLAGSWQHWWNVDTPRVGPRWLQWLWPLLYSMVVAAGFTVLVVGLFGQADGAWRRGAVWAEWYGRNLVTALCITVAVQVLMLLTRRLAGPARVRALRGWRRRLYFALVPLPGVVLGGLASMVLQGQHLDAALLADSNALVGGLLLMLLVALVFNLLWSARAAEVAARMQATEARLQLLQAQIEPHFLFNTLANVLSLMDHDAPRARQMLETFIDYLRGALGQLRDDRSTVADELALAQAYLALMAQRMGERLRFEVQADEQVRALPLPPLLLQPLVENAIRHGLEPSIDGGQVQVQAQRIGDTLRLTVRDDGLGLDAPRRPGPRGAGIAVANIRERLATRYGPAASLTLSAAQPGTLATLDLPIPPA